MTEYRILIVDDQRDVRHMLRSHLESLGLGLLVTEVPSGEEALLIMSRHAFHLLITNLRLAGMSGLELLPKARRRQPELKAILIAVNADDALQSQARKAGVDHLLRKPVEVSRLIAAVKSSLRLDQDATPESLLEDLTTSVEEENQPQANLSERLSLLRQELSAISVSLLDDNGRIVAQAGDWPSGANLTILIPSLMAVFSAGVKVTHSLGVERPDDLFFFAGVGYDLTLAHVGDLAVLLILSTKGLRGRIGDNLLQIVRQTAVDVLQILEGMGLVVTQPADLPEVSAPIEAGVETDDDLEELEAILQTAAQQKLDTDDLDEFWASVADEFPEEKAPGTGELSYDQAHQIGLTPEESLQSPQV